MKTEILKACEQVIAAAANGIYQGVLLALLVGICLRFCRRTNAATRHAIWFATLLLVVALIPAHILLNCLLPAVAKSTPTAQTTPNAEHFFNTPQNYLLLQSDSDRATPSEIHPSGRPISGDFLTPSAPPAETTTETRPLSDEEVEAELLGSLPEPAGELGRSSNDFFLLPGSGNSGSQTAQPGFLERVVSRLLKPLSWEVAPSAGLARNIVLWLLGTWLLVSAVRMSLLVWRLAQIRRLKNEAQPVTGPLDQLFRRLRNRLRVNRQVVLKLSFRQRTPVLLGFLHPAIILPKTAQPADLEETEQILRHELAHVARWDDWANLAQHVIQAAVFFHPAVFWISRHLSLEREIACDDFVLQQGGRPRTYALVLASLAGRIHGARALLAPGISVNKSQLQQRITMILNTHRNISPRLAKTRLGFITGAAVLAALLALTTGPRLVLAQTAPTPATAATVSADQANANENDTAVALPALSPYPAPLLILAQSDTPNQPSGGLAPGPKAKPENDDDPPPRPAFAPATPPVRALAPAAPMTLMAPVPPMAALPPVAAVPPVPPVVAMCPDMPGPAAQTVPRHKAIPPGAKESSSVERRLERVERMLESIMAQQNSKPGKWTSGTSGFAFSWAQPAAPNKPLDTDQLNESIKRQTLSAMDQAKRAEDQARQSADLFKQKANADEASADTQRQHADSMRREAFQKQLEAVRRARQSLQREVERLDRQIERLQKDQQRMDGEQGNKDSGKALLDDGDDELIAPETALIP